VERLAGRGVDEGHRKQRQDGAMEHCLPEGQAVAPTVQLGVEELPLGHLVVPKHPASPLDCQVPFILSEGVDADFFNLGQNGLALGKLASEAPGCPRVIDGTTEILKVFMGCSWVIRCRRP
jgi:hypothetical protein